MVFTGIVQAIGIATWGCGGKPGRLHIHAPNFFKSVTIGASVCVSGVCLTVVEIISPDECAFDVMEETLKLVCLSAKHQNLELPMALGDPIGGHTVTGHVDTTAVVTAVNCKADGSRDIWFRVPKVLENQSLVVYKGSIALHGTSLTIAELQDENTHIRVSLIPHTLAVTILGGVKEGDLLNVEYDHALKAAQQQSRMMAHQVLASTAASPAASKLHVRAYSDEAWMERAIELSLKGRYTTAPNPIVGCVLVDPHHGREIGCGFHQFAGEAHAEIMALQDATERGQNTTGATLYITLEPCSHTGRTGPCTNALIEAGIGRVVVGVQDPDPRVSGTGIQALRDAGIVVTIGVLQKQVLNSPLRYYIAHRTQKRPFVTIKVAPSLDGALACGDGSSQWITGDLAREDVQDLRTESQAIAVGSRTVRKDHPRLTVRRTGERLKENLRQGEDLELQPDTLETIISRYTPPARVVFDTSGETLAGLMLEGKEMDQQTEPLLRDDDTKGSTTYVIVASGQCSPATRSKLLSLRSQATNASSHIKLIEVDADKKTGKPCVRSALEALASEGILHLFVEGGTTLCHSFFENDVVDEIVVYVGAVLLGSGSLSWGQSLPRFAPDISQARRLELRRPPKVLGSDVRLVYSFCSNSSKL